MHYRRVQWRKRPAASYRAFDRRRGRRTGALAAASTDSGGEADFADGPLGALGFHSDVTFGPRNQSNPNSGIAASA